MGSFFVKIYPIKEYTINPKQAPIKIENIFIFIALLYLQVV